jgi:predicted SnoaL-like aldol condensation-catalyzing enzyme
MQTFLRPLEYEHNLPTKPAGRNRWRQNQGDPKMRESIAKRNKAFVLEAFETLFNRKDFVAAEKFWSSNYIQHSAHIPPGRDGLFALVKSAPREMKYENSLIMAEGDMLMLHGRFSGLGQPANWIVVDIVRIEKGLLAEHWDVIEDEVTREKSASGLPMFGAAFLS